MNAQPVEMLAAMDEAVQAIEAQWAVYEGAGRLAKARAAVADLLEASARTVLAFEALGLATGVVPSLEARRECEAALVAQKDALARIGGAA